ncbi:MAG: tRNA (N6-threonylcarbamoyladenosine(37)-N6)-methyltransferase TrmO, partial [Acinetobacter sp.]
RPAYQDDEARVYKMKFAAFDVAFTVSEMIVNIRAVELES